MKTNKALLIALPLALAACGGGGGGDNPAVDNPKTLAPNTNTQNNVQDANPGKYGLTTQDVKEAENASKNLQGMSSYHGYVTSGALSEIGDKKASKLDTAYNQFKRQLHTNSHLDVVFIPTREEAKGIGENEPLRIGNVDAYIGNRIYASATSYRKFDYFLASNDSNYLYTQFGIGKNMDANPIYVAYYRGNTTPENLMPKSGTANYKGDFIAWPDLISSSPKDAVGTVAANVDFGARDASFNFALPNGYRGNIDAKIVGSVFLGKQGDKKAIEGLFAVGNAAEMTGAYADGDANVIGVFGAKRQ
nr:MAG TPA: hypothetical protein [Caudoviricetes sp.]